MIITSIKEKSITWHLDIKKCFCLKVELTISNIHFDFLDEKFLVNIKNGSTLDLQLLTKSQSDIHNYAGSIHTVVSVTWGDLG